MLYPENNSWQLKLVQKVKIHYASCTRFTFNLHNMSHYRHFIAPTIIWPEFTQFPSCISVFDVFEGTSTRVCVLLHLLEGQIGTRYISAPKELKKRELPGESTAHFPFQFWYCNLSVAVTTINIHKSGWHPLRSPGTILLRTLVAHSSFSEVLSSQIRIESCYLPCHT